MSLSKKKMKKLFRFFCLFGLHYKKQYTWIAYGYNPYWAYGYKCKLCGKKCVYKPWHKQKLRLDRIAKILNSEHDFKQL